MRTLIISTVVVIASLTGLSIVEARTWTFRGDTKSFEGELIDVYGGLVSLLRPNGTVIQFHWGFLKEADRTFVDDWVAAESMPPGDEIEFKAIPYWQIIRYGGNAYPPRVALVVWIKVRGNLVAAATCHSHLKMEDVVANDGTKLEFCNIMLPKDTIDIARYGNFKQPASGFNFKLVFNAPDKPIGSIRRLAGSFRILTGRPQPITIEHIGTIENHELDDPLLEKAGLAAVENPNPLDNGIFYEGQENEKQFALTVWGRKQRIYSVELLDAKGNLLEIDAGPSYSSNGQSTTYQFEFRPPGPVDPGMRLTVLTDAQSSHPVRIHGSKTSTERTENRAVDSAGAHARK